jgi:hypothetical protein
MKTGMKPIKQEQYIYEEQRVREIVALTVFEVPKVETSLDPCQIPEISEAVIGGVEAKAESRMAQPPS